MILDQTSEQCTSSDSDLLVPRLNGSTERRIAAVGSTVAHFTTLGAQMLMNRAIRIWVIFCSSSNYVSTRARGKWLTLGAKYRVFLAGVECKTLYGSTETRFSAVWSTVAHFTTLGARKFMNRTTRICINFWPSSNYVVTRARGKRGTKKTESEEVLISNWIP